MLTLEGSLAPLDAVAIGVSQRATIEWLAGSGVASVHLDGPEEEPTDIELRLVGRDFRVGDATLDGVAVESLDTLVETMKGMVRDRALVEVDWNGTVQKAVFQRCVPSQRLAEEWSVTLTFAWVQGPSYSVRLSRPVSASPVSFAASLEAAFDEGMASAQSALASIQRPIADVEMAISRVRENITQVSNAADSLQTTLRAPLGVWKTVGDTIAQLMTTTGDVFEALVAPGVEWTQSEDARMQILGRTARSELMRAMATVRHRAVLERKSFRPESDILAIHEGVDGETIWSVARLWYGDARLGPAISRRNGLISTAIRSGQRLVIPHREWVERELGGRIPARARYDERAQRRSYQP